MGPPGAVDREFLFFMYIYSSSFVLCCVPLPSVSLHSWTQRSPPESSWSPVIWGTKCTHEAIGGNITLDYPEGTTFISFGRFLGILGHKMHPRGYRWKYYSRLPWGDHFLMVLRAKWLETYRKWPSKSWYSFANRFLFFAMLRVICPSTFPGRGIYEVSVSQTPKIFGYRSPKFQHVWRIGRQICFSPARQRFQGLFCMRTFDKPARFYDTRNSRNSRHSNLGIGHLRSLIGPLFVARLNSAEHAR